MNAFLQDKYIMMRMGRPAMKPTPDEKIGTLLILSASFGLGSKHCGCTAAKLASAAPAVLRKPEECEYLTTRSEPRDVATCTWAMSREEVATQRRTSGVRRTAQR